MRTIMTLALLFLVACSSGQNKPKLQDDSTGVTLEQEKQDADTELQAGGAGGTGSYCEEGEPVFTVPELQRDPECTERDGDRMCLLDTFVTVLSDGGSKSCWLSDCNVCGEGAFTVKCSEGTILDAGFCTPIGEGLGCCTL